MADGRQSSALDLLAESSASRSMQSEQPATPSEAEKLQVQEKLEKARARVGASLAAIPTGREYDAPPNAADETVYDALEKAYNAAFQVHAAEKEDVYMEEKSGNEDGEGAGKCASETNKIGLVDQESRVKNEHATQVGTLKSMCLSTMKQNGHDPTKEGIPVKDNNGAGSGQKVSSKSMTTESESAAATVIKETQPATKKAASVSAESVATTASPPQSPMSAHNRTSSEDGFVSTPELKRGSRDVEMKPEDDEEDRVERADHLSLNEFLISELEEYCARILQRATLKNNTSDVRNLARITGLQLYQDHQRALMDFDDEWKRSHANNYRGYTATSTEKLPAVPSTITTNPFQQVGAGPNSADEWPTLLKEVKVSSTKANPAEMPCADTQEAIKGLFASYTRGSNGIITGVDNCQEERRKIAEFMTKVTSSQSTSAFYVVIAAGSDLAEWENALSARQLVQLYPYWGSKEDRLQLLQLLSNEYFSSRSLSAHVLLTSYEVFMEDISVVTSLQCQFSVIDIPERATGKKITAIWPQLLSLRCRQRLLLCRPSFEIDTRKLLHFLVPELFSSRRKLLAWNSAALHTDQIREVCDVIRSFLLISDSEAANAFITKVEELTKDQAEREMAALDTLNKEGMGMGRAIEPSIMVPVKRVLSSKSRPRVSGHIPSKSKLVLPPNVASEAPDTQLSIHAPKFLPQKRTESDDTSRSRQRVGRCGKCAGCLTEDCMKCGHCQDMKKYGGPGLRKQSCKNRKCLNPRLWGLASRKRKRSKTKRTATHGEMNTDMDDNASAAYSSVESDGESVSTYGNGDSDDESTMDSPHDLLLPASDTLMDDHLTLSDLSSRSASARSRVMRCGDCAGCTASDCMKCPHCLDMKKYGGPGLRKQTCKKRKCIAPKVVMLNQAKGGHDQYVDEHGNVVSNGPNDSAFPGFYDAPDSSDRVESTVTASPNSKRPSDVVSVVQECERFVKPRLAFSCKDCAARFSSKLLVDFHARVEHSLAAGESAVAPTTVEREASRLFSCAIYQNAVLSAHLKPQDRTPSCSPLGYAKLEGRDFQYFFIEPLIVLGRMNLPWRKLYKDLGFENLRGLTGGSVDCHVGSDSMIATTHAVISWDARLDSFTIECLSLRVPISVNGREVRFSSPPAALSSRNLVQIGASVFYFLLPKTTKTSDTVEENCTPRA